MPSAVRKNNRSLVERHIKACGYKQWKAKRGGFWFYSISWIY